MSSNRHFIFSEAPAMTTDSQSFSFSAASPFTLSTQDIRSFSFSTGSNDSKKNKTFRKAVRRKGCQRLQQSPSLEDQANTRSDFKSAEKVRQNKAERKETNPEPFTNSPLPLTMVSRIFNGIPQSPHFYQLYSLSESTRKNLISAWDHTFEETVKEIQSLQPSNFWVRAKELWKIMEDLQNMGYNVIFLRRRLVELSEVMDELKVAEFQIKGLKVKAENHRMEKSRLENVIKNFKLMVKEEEECMESVLVEVEKLENGLQKFESDFAKLAIKYLW